MATLSFDGDSEPELVAKVRRWLHSTEQPSSHLEPTEAVVRLSDLTKDALSVVTLAAPEPIGQSDLVRSLSRLGYEAADQTAQVVVTGLNAVADLSRDGLMRRVRQARQAAAYQMESLVARQVLRGLRGL
jgi:hypothetical protein